MREHALYPVIPLIGAVIVANAPGVAMVFVTWMGVLLKSRDRAEEIREILMHPSGVGRLEPSINNEDPEFHTGRDGVGDHGQHQYHAPGSNQFPGISHLPGGPIGPTGGPPDAGMLPGN